MRLIIPLAALALVSACAWMQRDDETRARAAEVKNAVDAPYDVRFIDTMSEHHRQGVAMGELAVQKAKHAELRELAAKMTHEQTKDIAELRRARDKAAKGADVAVDRTLPGVAAQPPIDMAALQKAKGEAFDQKFIDASVQHHQAALTLARDAAERADSADVRDLAAGTAKQQAKELEQLQRWRTEWFER